MLVLDDRTGWLNPAGTSARRSRGPRARRALGSSTAGAVEPTQDQPPSDVPRRRRSSAASEKRSSGSPSPVRAIEAGLVRDETRLDRADAAGPGLLGPRRPSGRGAPPTTWPAPRPRRTRRIAAEEAQAASQDAEHARRRRSRSGRCPRGPALRRQSEARSPPGVSRRWAGVARGGVEPPTYRFQVPGEPRASIENIQPELRGDLRPPRADGRETSDAAEGPLGGELFSCVRRPVHRCRRAPVPFRARPGRARSQRSRGRGTPPTRHGHQVGTPGTKNDASAEIAVTPMRTTATHIAMRGPRPEAHSPSAMSVPSPTTIPNAIWSAGTPARNEYASSKSPSTASRMTPMVTVRLATTGPHTSVAGRCHARRMASVTLDRPLSYLVHPQGVAEASIRPRCSSESNGEAVPAGPRWRSTPTPTSTPCARRSTPSSGRTCEGRC